MRRRLLVWAGILIAIAVVAGFLYRRWIFGPAHFSYSLGTTPDQSLPRDQQSRPGADLAKTGADDFPEFLGRGRHAAVEHITLDPDWKTHPPRLLWRHAIGAAWSSFSAVNGFAVTMEQRGDEEQVSCYSVATGEHYWTANWNERFTIMGVGPRSTPTIASGRVYAIGAWGHLVCLDGMNGAVIWERELLKDLGMHWTDEDRAVRFGRAASPLVTGGLVIVPGGGLSGKCVSLLAYDAATGTPRWRGGDRQISYSSPVLAELLGEEQVLIVNEDSVSGHAPDIGVERWSYPWPGDSSTDANVSQPVVLSSNRVLLSKGYGRGASVIELSHATSGDAIQVRRVWKNSSVLHTRFTNVAIWDHHAYGLSEGVLECVDLETGERSWKDGKYGSGQILRVRDNLLVLGQSGELALVRCDPKIPNAASGRMQVLTGTAWNNPVLYGRFLLVRNATEAACYELATLPK